MDDSSAGDVGVATALGRICALEAKLRQAIQHTHLLSSSFESDPAAADREREALLAIRSATRLVSTVHSYQTSCDLLVDTPVGQEGITTVAENSLNCWKTNSETSGVFMTTSLMTRYFVCNVYQQLSTPHIQLAMEPNTLSLAADYCCCDADCSTQPA